MDTTNTLPEFEAFESIPRLMRDVVITEKIDGANAQVYVAEDGRIFAGSRNKWLGEGKSEDPFGFYRWVKSNEEELRTRLGFGRHYGEWYGGSIQRKYGLKEKRFALFNTHRWTAETKPNCCHTVPVLYAGKFSTDRVLEQLDLLRLNGSVAVPGFKDPEGVVVFFTGSNRLFKVTLDGDGHKFEKVSK